MIPSAKIYKPNPGPAYDVASKPKAASQSINKGNPFSSKSIQFDHRTKAGIVANKTALEISRETSRGLSGVLPSRVSQRGIEIEILSLALPSPFVLARDSSGQDSIEFGKGVGRDLNGGLALGFGAFLRFSCFFLLLEVWIFWTIDFRCFLFVS